MRARSWCVALLLVAGAAQAEMRAMVVETDPPGETITLGRDEVLWVRIAYVADTPVRIWARPYFQGKEVPAHSNPSVTYTGAGNALGWFSFRQAAQVDEVRLQLGTPSSSQALEAARHPVRITATGQPAAPRAGAPWVAELRRETDALSRAQREASASQPLRAGDTALTYGLMSLVAAVVIGVPALLVWTVWKAARGELRVRRADTVPYAASALAGLFVCGAISFAAGGREAWDSGLYYSFGIPAMVLAIFAISYLFPKASWRWTLAMAAGQLAAMLFGGASLSLWPLAILAMLFYSLPQFAAGFFASRLALRGQG